VQSPVNSNPSKITLERPEKSTKVDPSSGKLHFDGWEVETALSSLKMGRANDPPANQVTSTPI
jgi:hypothetical protein